MERHLELTPWIPGRAEDLDELAVRAASEGGPALAAAFYEHAASTASDPALRAALILAGAWSGHDAGLAQRAAEMLDAVERPLLDHAGKARADALEARIGFLGARPVESHLDLGDAARALRPWDQRLARQMHLASLAAAVVLGRDRDRRLWRSELAAARSAFGPEQAGDATTRLLDALILEAEQGRGAARRAVREALNGVVLAAERSALDAVDTCWLACRVAARLWDDESWHRLATSMVLVARRSGRHVDLPTALGEWASARLAAGDLAAAGAAAAEIGAMGKVGSTPFTSQVVPELMAWRGEEWSAGTARSAADATSRSDADDDADGEASVPAGSAWSRAVLCNGLRRYSDAMAAAKEGLHDTSALGLRHWCLVELVEAAARGGEGELAAAAAGEVSAEARAAGTAWSLGVDALSAALTSAPDRAEALFEKSIECLASSRAAGQLARARLLYGEWLRREGRRADARHQLRQAEQSLYAIGARPSPSAPRTSSARPASTSTGAPRGEAASSRPKRPKSLAWRPTATATARSALSSTSARGRSSTT
ncbi:MAG TPA: hypothetical protein VMD59_10465 [Acidimicrobiales bacterium]|nr:hypothetical protein [Acidimicrobiales bacterium]